MAAQPLGESTIPPSFTSSANLLRTHCPFTQVINVDVKQYWPHTAIVKVKALDSVVFTETCQRNKKNKPKNFPPPPTPRDVFCSALYPDTSLLLCLQREFARGMTPSQKSHRHVAKQINDVRAHRQNAINRKRYKLFTTQ